MAKDFRAIKKEGGCVIHVAVLWCGLDREEMDQKERRLAELVLTAALRKWKRENSRWVGSKSSQEQADSVCELDN